MSDPAMSDVAMSNVQAHGTAQALPALMANAIATMQNIADSVKTELAPVLARVDSLEQTVGEKMVIGQKLHKLASDALKESREISQSCYATKTEIDQMIMQAQTRDEHLTSKVQTLRKENMDLRKFTKQEMVKIHENEDDTNDKIIALWDEAHGLRVQLEQDVERLWNENAELKTKFAKLERHAKELSHANAEFKSKFAKGTTPSECASGSAVAPVTNDIMQPKQKVGKKIGNSTYYGMYISQEWQPIRGHIGYGIKKCTFMSPQTGRGYQVRALQKIQKIHQQIANGQIPGDLSHDNVRVCAMLLPGKRLTLAAAQKTRNDQFHKIGLKYECKRINGAMHERVVPV